jgi:signal transduction histidine kinase
MLEFPARDCPLAVALAARLRASSSELTHRWLERIAARVSLQPLEVFPTADLLDHVPLLIIGIADYLEEPSAEISAEAPVVGKAMELGALRHAQGFDAYEILKEYEILGGILFHHLAIAADQMPEPCAKSELLACGQRLFRAIAIIQQATTTHFLRLAQEQVNEREERIRTFNRAVSHEIKNRIGTILGSANLLHDIADMPAGQRDQFIEIIRRNAREMQGAVDNVLAIARTAHDPRRQRHVRLPEAVQEAVRQLREAAQAARVDIVISPGIPDLEVNAAVVELCLTNYLSNSIKYADPGRGRSRAEVSARLEESEPAAAESPGGATPTRREVVVRVTDNGLGVPPGKREKLFSRFFRAHETITNAEGTGLGLSIVREAAESLGGRAWAEFPAEGSIFAFSMPERRNEERRTDSPRESRRESLPA